MTTPNMIDLSPQAIRDHFETMDPQAHHGLVAWIQTLDDDTLHAISEDVCNDPYIWDVLHRSMIASAESLKDWKDEVRG